MSNDNNVKKMDKMVPELNAVIVLRNILAEQVSPQALIFPYADEHDNIDGNIVSTCGLVRIPLSEDDIVSTPRKITDKHGNVKDVCDVYLGKTKYMVYYTREYITDFANNDVTATNNGHFGDWIDTFQLVENMKAGKKVINKARRIDAQKQEMELMQTDRKLQLVNHEAKIHDMSDKSAAKNILSVDFSK